MINKTPKTTDLMEGEARHIFVARSRFPRDSISLAPFSLSHSTVNIHTRNWNQVMYYTLKWRLAFRHDSTEGPWVMRQTYTPGALPDVHTCRTHPVAAAAESRQGTRVQNTKLLHKPAFNPLIKAEKIQRSCLNFF